MCGRYVVTSDTPSMYGLFSIPEPPVQDREVEPEPPPRYNIAPTTTVPVVVEPLAKDGSGPARRLAMMRWGLVPSWAKDPSVGSRMFNARAESLQEKPAYRKAFAARRALIPANGYYEWQRTAHGKQPYYITPADGALMAFAGVYEFWRSPDGTWVLSVSQVTTDAVGPVADIHDRMPLILPAADWDTWIDPTRTGDQVSELLSPPSAELVAGLELRPVSSRVGAVANDGPDLIAPI